MSGPKLEAINLTKRYGSFTALNNLNLKIEGPKCVGFLGPNGAGKTTTLKIFCDMIRATKGEAHINDLEIRRDKKKALASCGVLIESPEIYPALTAREALSMFAELKGVPRVERRKTVEEMARLVRMEPWLDKKFGGFSRGMKQRINIAAALLNDPDILLLDEPTTGLDPRGMTEVREMIKEIKGRKKLVFMSSHLLNEVSDVCDEVAMIDKGTLLFYDTLEIATAKFTRGTSLFEASFSKPLLDFATMRDRLGSIPLVSSVDQPDEFRIRVSFSGGTKIQEEIVATIAAMRLGLLSFKASSSALEAAYLDLVSEGV